MDGAAARAAEAAFGALDGNAQWVARTLVLRMVRVDAVGEPTRCRVTAAELAEQPALAGIARRLVAARMLTASADGVGITHDAFLHTRPRLAGWLDADQPGHRTRGSLIDAARRWREGGCREDALLRGPALTSALDWAASARGEELLSSEREFLRAGLDHQSRHHAAQHGRVRRLRLAVAVLAVLAVLTSALVAVSAAAVVARPDPVLGACVAPAR